jgi:uncharacterized protein YjbI with pentapeptide repeats
MRSVVSGGNPDLWVKWRKALPRVRPDLSGVVVEYPSFVGDFSFTNLRHAKLTTPHFYNVVFFHTDLSYSIIKDTKVILTYGSPPPIRCRNSSFYKAKFNNVKLPYSFFTNTNFKETEITNTVFDYASFKNVSFVKAKIVNSTFDGPIVHANFSGATIIKSKIYGILGAKPGIVDVNFNNATLKECSLSGVITNTTFVNANLSGTEVVPVDLINVNFANANLTNVDFSKAKFKNVIFKNADMKGAKIQRKWYNYIKRQGVRNFDKIIWVG